MTNKIDINGVISAVEDILNTADSMLDMNKDKVNSIESACSFRYIVDEILDDSIPILIDAVDKQFPNDGKLSEITKRWRESLSKIVSKCESIIGKYIIDDNTDVNIDDVDIDWFIPHELTEEYICSVADYIEGKLPLLKYEVGCKQLSLIEMIENAAIVKYKEFDNTSSTMYYTFYWWKNKINNHWYATDDSLSTIYELYNGNPKIEGVTLTTHNKTTKEMKIIDLYNETPVYHGYVYNRRRIGYDKEILNEEIMVEYTTHGAKIL